MRSTFAAALFPVLLAAPLAASPNPATPIDSASIDTAALAAFADAELAKAYPADGPGAAALVKLGDRVVLRKGYGMANLDLGVAIAPEQVFQIGSVTKQFTAAAILKLAEAGKLSLADPIQKYVPDFPTGDATVTIEHLLHHTSGVPSYTDMAEWMPRWREDMTLTTLIDLFRGKPLDFVPGTSWNYSNSGYVLLGAVIEQASGRSYEEYVESELFAPLGMNDSRYGHQHELVRGRVQGYQRGSAGWENAPYLSLTQPHAAGSLFSTVDDLARWSEALEAGRVVSSASLGRMLTPARITGGEQDGVTTRYGYGIAVSEIGGRRVHEHGGGIHGFVSELMRLPDDRLTIVILSNHTESSPGGLARQIAERAVGGGAAPTGTIALTESQLDAYVGVYRVAEAPAQRRVISRTGSTLSLQRTGGSKFPLVPVADDRFLIVDGGTKVAFGRDASGNVTHLLVDNGFGPLFRSLRTDEPLPVERQAIAVDPAWLDGLVGVYTIAPGFELAITREDSRLWSQATGQDRLEIFPESPTVWFLKVVDATLEFVRTGSDPATSLVLRQGGQTIPAPRKP